MPVRKEVEILTYSDIFRQNVVPVSSKLGLHCPADMFCYASHCCGFVLFSRARGGVHRHDSKGKEKDEGSNNNDGNFHILQVIRWMILTVIAIYVGLFIFENLPTSLIVGGLVAQVGPISSLAFKINKHKILKVGHLALLSSFPFFSINSPSFLLSVMMVLLNHYLAFSFFGENYYPFSEVT